MTTTQHALDGRIPVFTLGDRMAKALDVAGLSRAEMAEYMDVSTETIRRWTTDSTPVRRSTLRLWALATGVDLEWLETGRARRDSNPKPSDP